MCQHARRTSATHDAFFQQMVPTTRRRDFPPLKRRGGGIRFPFSVSPLAKQLHNEQMIEVTDFIRRRGGQVTLSIDNEFISNEKMDSLTLLTVWKIVQNKGFIRYTDFLQYLMKFILEHICASFHTLDVLDVVTGNMLDNSEDFCKIELFYAKHSFFGAC